MQEEKEKKRKAIRKDGMSGITEEESAKKTWSRRWRSERAESQLALSIGACVAGSGGQLLTK